MSIESTFIAKLRGEIELQREKALATLVDGKLDEKGYGFACGYLRALNDLVRPRTADQQPGIIDQVIEDMRKD